MNLTPGLVRITTDGAIGKLGLPVRVFHVQVVSGTQNSICYLRHGESATDTIVAQVYGITNNAIDRSFNGGMYFERGCFADVDTAVSFVSIIYTEEK
jgi:hypothetical protein